MPRHIRLYCYTFSLPLNRMRIALAGGQRSCSERYRVPQSEGRKLMPGVWELYRCTWLLGRSK